MIMTSKIFVQNVAPDRPEQIHQAVQHLLDSLPATQNLRPDSRVLIKPNLLAAHAPEKAITTHPEVLRGVVFALRNYGVQNITIADSPGGIYTPSSMENIYKTCGLWELGQESGVTLYTACQSGQTQTRGQLVQAFTLIQPVLDADFIINVPKFKTHVLTGMTGAVKNLFGCVPGLQKAEFHMRFPERKHFGQMLVDLCERVRPDIHLVDGVLAMEGDGPSGGNVRLLGLLLAGQDPYQMDLTLCHSMGLSPERVPFLQAAGARGLCAEAFSPDWVQEGHADPIENFLPPRSYEGRLDYTPKIPQIFSGLIPVFSRRMAPHPHIRRKKCIGCGKCAGLCPEKVITLQNKKARIASKNCIRCFCCHEICPVQAIDVRAMRLFRH